MFDHVMLFADEAAALTALKPLGYAMTDEDGNDQFKASQVLVVRLVLVDAVWDNSDPENPILTTPEVVAPGFYVVVSAKAQDESLKALPNNACRLVADRTLIGKRTPAEWDYTDPDNPVLISGNEPVPIIVYEAPDLDAGTLSKARIDPMFAGANYPFRS